MAELSTDLNLPNTDFFIDETSNYFYGWLQNSQNGYAGLYWESREDENGSFIYPKDREDRFIRSLKDGGILGSIETAEDSWVTREYIRWTLEDEIGFVSADGTWAFKTDAYKNAYVYNNLNVSRNVTAEALYGDGFNITNLDASKIKQGVINKDRLPELISSDSTGNSLTATKLEKEITLTFTGDVTGEISLDGSIDKNILLNVQNDSHTHDNNYYNKTISDTRYLSINGTAANSELLDGKDSSYFATEEDLQEQKLRIDNILNLDDSDLDLFNDIVNVINEIDTSDEALTSMLKNIEDNISNETIRAIEAESEIKNDLEFEISRAQTAENNLEVLINNSIIDGTSKITEIENNLNEKINTEINRAEIKEFEIENNLNSEIQRAKEEELNIKDIIDKNNINFTNITRDLDTKISEEVLRAQTNEGNLNNNILTETQRATTAEQNLSTLINNEINRSTLAEQELNTSINEEINRATQKEQEILDFLNARIDTQRTRIDDILNLSSEDADTFQEIVDLINSIDTENDEAFATFALETNDQLLNLNTQLNNEINRALNSENDIKADLDLEIIRAKDTENQLQTKFIETSNQLNTKDTELDTKINTEIQRAYRTEQDLLIKINEEIDRAQEAENNINITLNDTEAELNNEIKLLEAKTIVSLNDEINRAKLAEDYILNTLNERIQNEEQLARINENNLDIRISELSLNIENEISRAISTEEELKEKIEINEIEIANIDKNLTSEIDDIKINIESTKEYLDNKLIDEITRSIEKDMELESNINEEITRAETKENDLEKAIETEKERIDQILELSDADLDSFKEIVDLINNVDIVNDQAFGNFVTSTTQNLDEIKTNLDAEIIRATNKETELESNLNKEITISRTIENELLNKTEEIDIKLDEEIIRATEAEANIYTKAETDERFLGITATATDSYRLNNETAEDFRNAYLEAVGDSTVGASTTTISYVIQKDECLVYWDDTKSINFITLTNTPVGDIIDLTIDTDGETITINDKVNQSDKRIEFLEDLNLNNSTAYCTYLRMA